MVSKKKKHKLPDGPKPFLTKRRKRLLIRLILGGLVVGAGVVLYKPEVIKDDEKRQKVEEVRQKVLSANEEAQELVNEKLPIIGESMSGAASKLPTKKVLGEDDVYVEEVVKEATSKIQSLPKEQFERAKKEFCADLIEEAVKACVQP